MESARKKLILVDDDITNLTIGKNILSAHYDVFTVPSGEKLFKILEKITPDLVLLDIEMPLKNGYEVLKELKSKPPAIADIPVIFLTARSDSASELEGLAMGAADYFSKPFSPPLLLKRVELHILVQEQKRELQEYRKKCSF
ncbi:response regulator [Breznakiellaceae bacterium SP9]